MTSIDAQNSMIELGFTPMEASVYLLLLGSPPLTGYGIAKQLGKPAPYVYRAIDALVQKNALFLDKSETKKYRAVPFAELLERLKLSFQNRCDTAKERMTQIQTAIFDDRVYHLNSVDQVFERAQTMIADARELLYIDAFPKALTRIASLLETAQSRGVTVGAVVYEPIKLNIASVMQFRTERLVWDWPTRQWLLVAVDNTQYLIALLSGNCERVHQAIWTASPVLAYVQQFMMGSELLLGQMLETLYSGGGNAELLDTYHRWQETFGKVKPSGVDRFEQLFGKVE